VTLPEDGDALRRALGLEAAGFNLHGVLGAADWDARVPSAWRCAALLPGARSALVLGAGGRALFTAFSASPEAAAGRRDPLDAYTLRVTRAAADRGAEDLLRHLISKEFPDDGILGEEFEEKAGTSGWRWIFDPVDGTKSFIHGVPLFGTLIGLEYQVEQVLGLCRFPALNEVVYGAKGLGAWWQVGDRERRPARVSGVSRLEEALFCTTTIQGWRRLGRQQAFEQLCESTAISRGWGDCYGHILVATGRADLMVDPQLNAWDCAALVPIVQEAGGHFADFTGAVDIHSGNGFSVNGELKGAVLEILKPAQAV